MPNAWTNHIKDGIVSLSKALTKIIIQPFYIITINKKKNQFYFKIK